MSRTRQNGRLGIALVIALFLAACSGVTENTPVPAPEQTAEAAQEQEQQSALLDTAWKVVSIGAEEPVLAVPDSYPSVDFLGTRYTGYTGCNFFLGTYDVDGDALGMKTPAVTQGACENELLFRQEDIFLSALTATSSYEIDGDRLILYVLDSPSLTLEPLEPVPFEGTTWDFKFLGTGEAVWLPVIPGTSITAKFEGDTISGSAGCNDYSGAFTRDGNQMTFGPLAVTAMECPEPEGIMEQEQRYLEALQRTGSIAQYTRSFELFDTEKAPLMLFHAD